MPALDIRIIRSKRKTMALSVSAPATIVVKAPTFTPKFFIDRFIKANEEWIKKQFEKLQSHSQTHKKTYKDGEQFLYLGMKVQLQLVDASEIRLDKDKLLFPKVLEFRIQKSLQTWFRTQAEKLITQQVAYFAKQMRTNYTELTFSDTKSQWGRCTHDNRLQFSWRLIMTPITTINYVVIHELAHTFERNHSREFWSIVRKYCPSYNRQRNWLKEHGNSLVV